MKWKRQRRAIEELPAPRFYDCDDKPTRYGGGPGQIINLALIDPRKVLRIVRTESYQGYSRVNLIDGTTVTLRGRPEEVRNLLLGIEAAADGE